MIVNIDVDDAPGRGLWQKTHGGNPAVADEKVEILRASEQRIARTGRSFML